MKNIVYLLVWLITLILLLHKGKPVKCWYCSTEAALQGNFSCKDPFKPPPNAEDYVVDCDERFNRSLPSNASTVCFKMFSEYYVDLEKKMDQSWYRGCASVWSDATTLDCKQATGHIRGLQFYMQWPFRHTCSLCTTDKCNE